MGEIKMIQKRLGKYWIHAGLYRKGIALGFKIDIYGFDMECLFFYFGIEW
jgi:hypothetical protein